MLLKNLFYIFYIHFLQMPIPLSLKSSTWSIFQSCESMKEYAGNKLRLNSKADDPVCYIFAYKPNKENMFFKTHWYSLAVSPSYWRL